MHAMGWFAWSRCGCRVGTGQAHGAGFCQPSTLGGLQCRLGGSITRRSAGDGRMPRGRQSVPHGPCGGAQQPGLSAADREHPGGAHGDRDQEQRECSNPGLESLPPAAFVDSVDRVAGRIEGRMRRHVPRRWRRGQRGQTRLPEVGHSVVSRSLIAGFGVVAEDVNTPCHVPDCWQPPREFETSGYGERTGPRVTNLSVAYAAGPRFITVPATRDLMTNRPAKHQAQQDQWRRGRLGKCEELRG